MGKTAKGAVWLDKNKLSNFDFYQFWRNVNDEDVEKFLKLFTKINLKEITKLSQLKGQEINEAKKILAFEVTKMTRGLNLLKKLKKLLIIFLIKNKLMKELSHLEINSTEIEKNNIHNFRCNRKIKFN